MRSAFPFVKKNRRAVIMENQDVRTIEEKNPRDTAIGEHISNSAKWFRIGALAASQSISRQQWGWILRHGLTADDKLRFLRTLRAVLEELHALESTILESLRTPQKTR